MPDNRTPPPPEPLDYAHRWAQLVNRRRVQMEKANAAAGIRSEDYWSHRAKTYREALHARTDEDPFFLRVRAAVSAETSVLDVGAGTGRHTLALASHVRRITAVDPSDAMLGFLRQDIAERALNNVEVVHAEWMNANVEPADVVICSHVLYPIADILPFVRKLEAAARSRVFIYLRADPLPTDMGLWSEFHGERLQDQPVHMDLINVLAQISIFADTEVVEHRFSWNYATLDEAVAQVRHGLSLRDGDSQAMEKLRALLQGRLKQLPGGRLGPEIASARSAVISWRPRPQG
ncbi:MAG: class I SAM-dependent methyltransferase [Dehalococcoidia bacterium]